MSKNLTSLVFWSSLVASSLGIGGARSAHGQVATFQPLRFQPSYRFGLVMSLNTGDFDADGRVDFLVARYDGTADAFRNDGDFEFTSRARFKVATGLPLDVASADLDGDGDLDIVTASSDSALYVTRNLGSFDFAEPVSLPMPLPRIVRPFDMDGDGDLDLVVGTSTPNAYVLVNSGTGAFTIGGVIPAGSGADAVVAGDLDGDGLADVVVRRSLTRDCWYSRNLGGGAFAAPVQIPTPLDYGQIELTDFDHDGDLDLVTGNPGWRSISISLNQATGFALLPPISAQSIPERITLADYDGDGWMDVFAAGFDLAASFEGRHVSVIQNLHGQMSADQPLRIRGGGERDVSPRDIAASDFDGDGDVDLAVLSQFPFTVSFQVNHAGDFREPDRFEVRSDSGAPPAQVLVADFTGDGRADILTHESDGLTLFANRNGWRFTRSVDLEHDPVMSLSELAACDFDADGDPDVVANASGGGSVGRIVWYENRGGNGFARRKELVANSGIPIVADVNGDGLPDVVESFRTPPYPNRLRVHLNLGHGRLAAPATYVVPGATDNRLLSMSAGDLDGDGDLDMVAAFAASGLLEFPNLGNGTFGAPIALPSTSFVIQLDVVDIDGDGDLDVVHLGWNGSAYVIGFLVNSGGGNWVASQMTVPFQPVQFLAGDVDLDGDQDLIVFFHDRVLFLTNSGGTSFVTTRDEHVETGPALGELADLDGDGDLDLVHANPQVEMVFLRQNEVSAGTTYCFGDGSGTACPCGGSSAAGAQQGCANATGVGATLRANGRARLDQDTLRLAVNGTTGSPVLYLQGKLAANGGLGVPFGGGLLCIGSDVMRLGVVASATGSSLWPVPGGTALHVGGAFADTSGERVYQAWYRDVSGPCGQPVLNATNAVRVLWIP